jgi:predicted Zn-dependent peptidase
LEEALFPEGHPYHGARLTAASTAAVTFDDVRSFASRNYVPTNVTVRLEGDVPFESKALVALFEEAFPDALLAGTSSQCRHRASPDVPEPATTEMQTAEAAVWNQTLYLGWTAPPGYDEDYVTMLLAAGMLEEEIEYRLHWVRGLTGVKRDLAGTTCWVHPAQVASSLICRVDLPLGVKPKAVVRAVKEGLPNLWAHTQLPWHLSYLRDTVPFLWSAKMEQSVRMDDEALDMRARWIHFADNPTPFIALATRAGQMDTTDLTAFSKKWLQPDRMAIALLVPRPAESVEGSTAPSWGARLDAPADLILHPVRSDTSRITETRLERGIRLWTAPSGQGVPPYVITSLQGERLEPAAGTQEALRAMALWNPPTSPQELCVKTATWWRHWFGSHSAGSWAAGSAGNLDAQMWLLRIYLDTLELDASIRQARLDARSLWAFRDEAFALDYVLSYPWVLGDWKRSEALVGAIGPGIPWWERNRAARHLRVKDVRDWQRALFQPNRTVVMVAGATSDATALEVAERYLGGWKAKPVEVPEASRPHREPGQRQLFFVPIDRPLTEVAVSCPVRGWTPDTDAALEVLEGVVGRGMWQTFREQGRTYTPDVLIELVDDERALLHAWVYVLPGEGHLGAAAMLELLGMIASGPPPAVVDAEKLAAASSFGRDLAHAPGTVDRMASTFDHGGDLDDLRAWPARLASVDPSTIATMMAPCLGHEVVSITGSDDVEPTKALGFPIEVLDLHAMAAELSARME